MLAFVAQIMRQFDERLPQGSRSPGIFSAHFLEESLATKLFRLISLGNRPPQNFSAHFLEESAATKLFRLISSGNRPFTYSLISSGNRRMAYIELDVITTSDYRAEGA